jgi:hypothetical protein
MLPDAIEREREVMLEDSIEWLRARGYDRFAAHDLPGYREPAPVTIPILNVQMRPDLFASHDGMQPFVATVEPSTSLGEESCGRRWQALQSWAQTHGAELVVFVHPEDEVRATWIADHWHLDRAIIAPLPRRH